MNGAHDLGGMQGLGRIEVEQKEPVFHKDWEKVVFVMQWTTGFRGLLQYRRIPPQHGTDEPGSLSIIQVLRALAVRHGALYSSKKES